MKTVLIEDLGDMNPGELEPKAWNGSDEVPTSSPVVDNLPETQCMRARVAVFNTIMDAVVEDTINEKEATQPDTPVTENDVTEVTDPIVEQATALRIVPYTVKDNIRTLIAKHLRVRSKRAALFAKAAHAVAEAATETVAVPTTPEAGGSAAADPAYNAGTPAIDTPSESQNVDITKEVEDAVSEEIENPASHGTTTTALYRAAARRMFGKLEDTEATPGTSAEGDTTYNAGTPAIDTPSESQNVDITKEVEDAVSEEIENPASQGTTTTALYRRAARRMFGIMEDGSIEPGAVEPTAPAAEPAAPAVPEVSNPDAAPEIAVDPALDGSTQAEMRYLAKSAMNHRIATSRVSQRFSGVLVNRMLHELRYQLPEKFCAKYDVR